MTTEEAGYRATLYIIFNSLLGRKATDSWQGRQAISEKLAGPRSSGLR